MPTKQDAIRFFNENGFYIVTSPGQKEIAEELVKDGLLRLADPSWFTDGYDPDNIYVHSSIDCKVKMPVSLYKRIYTEPEYRQGEYVRVRLISSFEMPVNVIGRIVRTPYMATNPKEMVVGVIIDNADVVVRLADIHKS